MAMAATSCHGVVALLAVIFALGVVGASLATDPLDVNDVPMRTLEQKLYSSRPWERRLATGTVWCVAKSNLSDAALQGALDWVCGTQADQGQVNCGPLQSGGSCFTPDTVPAHSSWAFNAYFQSRNGTDSACDFQGTATQVTVDPSTSTCTYPGTLKEINGTIASNGTVVAAPPGQFSPNAGTAGFEPQYFSVSTAAMLMMYILT